MNRLIKIIPATFLASAFAVHSTAVLADHGSLGFGIGTASPIITQTGITLPAGMWAGGTITQFASFNSASDTTLLDLKNNAVDDAHGDVHSVKSLLTPSVFAAYGVSGYVIYFWRKAKGLQTSVISTSTDEPDERGLH